MSKEISIKSIIKKLIGNIEPVGESNSDREALKNLDDWIDVTEYMLSQLLDVASYESRYEASMEECGYKASSALVYFQDYTNLNTKE